MAKWGIPKKSIKNVAQRYWPYVRRPFFILKKCKYETPYRTGSFWNLPLFQVNMWQSMELLVCGLETSPLARRKMSTWWEMYQQIPSGYCTNFHSHFLWCFLLWLSGGYKYEYHRPWSSVYHGRGGQVEAGGFVKFLSHHFLFTTRWYVSTCHWMLRVCKKASTCWRAGELLER